MEVKELDELKELVDNKKTKKLDKLLKSKIVSKLINKIQELYNNISVKLIIKYNLHDELKQGKIYTILIAILALIILIVLTLFFAIAIHSILGIGLIFSFIRQIVFCIKWTYTIIKSKKDIIIKYLTNLLSDNKTIEKKIIKRKKYPSFEDTIMYDISDFIEELENSNLNINIIKDITIKLRNIILELKLSDDNFKDDFNSLEYKKEIIRKLNDIYFVYQNHLNKLKCQEEFLELKNDVLEQINEVENKVYIKKK